LLFKKKLSATTYLFLKNNCVFFTIDSSYYFVYKSIKIQLPKNEYLQDILYFQNVSE